MSARDRTVSATPLLAAFERRGVLDWADIHTAQHTLHLCGESDERVALAMALAVRALRLGSVCLDLDRAPHQEYLADDQMVTVEPGLWPDPGEWQASIEASPAVNVGDANDRIRPLRWIDSRLYLERYWREDRLVWRELRSRCASAVPDVDPARVAAALTQLFGDDPTQERPRLAAATSVYSLVTVIAGGPGTGKTTTIARLLALLAVVGSPTRRIALAAPTGKAAARMQEAVQQALSGLPGELSARLTGLLGTTLHRLLGPLPDARTRFRHDAENPLPHDVVVIDEMSMVSVTMMARLVSALRPDARLILVGDPHQLTSVDAGAVLTDVTAAEFDTHSGFRDSIQAATGQWVTQPTIELTHNWRFSGGIQALAQAIVAGDADGACAVLSVEQPDVELRDEATAQELVRQRLVGAGGAVHRAALAGDIPASLAALDSHRLLCAHRHGPYGVSAWQAQAERWLRHRVPGFGAEGEWYVGRPLLATENSSDLGLFNGDTGVIVSLGGHPRAVFDRAAGPAGVSPHLLEGVTSAFAMTVHKAQGSQFETVTIVLPPVDSPLLTRELLYTAVTRARRHVLLVGSLEAVRQAVSRPADRDTRLSR